MSLITLWRYLAWNKYTYYIYEVAYTRKKSSIQLTITLCKVWQFLKPSLTMHIPYLRSSFTFIQGSRLSYLILEIFFAQTSSRMMQRLAIETTTRLFFHTKFTGFSADFHYLVYSSMWKVLASRLVVTGSLQACSQEFAQGGSDFIETQESHTYFCFLRWSDKEGGNMPKLIFLTLYVFY